MSSSINFTRNVSNDILAIVNNYINLIVLNYSTDVEFSITGGDSCWNESGNVVFGNVEEYISSSVVVDEVEIDVGGTVGVGKVGSDRQTRIILVGDVGCEGEVAVRVVEGGFEGD